MALVTSILHQQNWGLHILWWLNWQTPLISRYPGACPYPRWSCTRLLKPPLRTNFQGTDFQPLPPISFLSLIKLLPARFTPKNPVYRDLDNTSIILSWGAVSIVQCSPCICWFLIPTASYTPILRYIYVQTPEKSSTNWIVYELRVTQWSAPPYTKDSTSEQRRAYLSSYTLYYLWATFFMHFFKTNFSYALHWLRFCWCSTTGAAQNERLTADLFDL